MLGSASVFPAGSGLTEPHRISGIQDGTGSAMYTLITGATGLVGRYLLRDLLLNGHQLAVVVRGSRRNDARDRIEQVLQYWEKEHQRTFPRPVVLNGDISQPGFGLSDDDREWLRKHCHSIIHSAAILEFFGKDRAGEPWRTNLDGTRHMLQLCRELGIRDIHYVSTAYVAGMQAGRVLEGSLVAGQTFRNDYEESKFEAEQLVREADFAEHVTVYRPAVIVGDSRTGYTNTYHGLFVYLRLMAMLIPSLPLGEDGRRKTPIRVRFTGREPRNLIPVDWVSAVMCRLFETPEARGLTYHLAPDNPITSRQVIDLCSEYFNSTGVIYEGDPEPQADDAVLSEDQKMFERLFQDNAETYAAYESTDNTFDMTNTKRFAGDIVCPDLDRTVIHRFIDYGNEDRWGKRKPDVQAVGCWLLDLLRGRATGSGAETAVVGLNLTGPGGCQATVRLCEGGVVSVERGLPVDGAPVLTAAAVDLLEVLSGSRPAALLSAGWDSGEAGQDELTEQLISALSSVGDDQTISV
ncbi:MAG TPA: Male sterility domain protein [Planctomycetaceae bacterium]|nr:Male sterility domain protein [Planctomycetaceae bacterium]